MKKQDCILGGFFCDGCQNCPDERTCIVCGGVFEIATFPADGELCVACYGERLAFEKHALEQRQKRERFRQNMRREYARKKYNFRPGKVEWKAPNELPPEIPCGNCGKVIPIANFAAHVMECLSGLLTVDDR